MDPFSPFCTVEMVGGPRDGEEFAIQAPLKSLIMLHDKPDGDEMKQVNAKSYAYLRRGDSNLYDYQGFKSTKEVNDLLESEGQEKWDTD